MSPAHDVIGVITMLPTALPGPGEREERVQHVGEEGLQAVASALVLQSQSNDSDRLSEAQTASDSSRIVQISSDWLR